jgi:hypothetical protein
VTTATLTVHGTAAGADWVEIRCECTPDVTGGPIDPPDSGARMIEMIATVQRRHLADAGCTCERLVAILDADAQPSN